MLADIYIPFKLLRQFEKLTTDKAADFVECLSHMSVLGAIWLY